MSRSTLITISDTLLEPYYITRDDHCFTVHERIKPKSGHFRTKGKGKEYSKPQGYYPTLEQALVKISKEQFVMEGPNEKNLLQVIENLLTTQNNIKEFIYANKERTRSAV